MFAICSRQEFVRAIFGNPLRVACHPACGDDNGAKRVDSRTRSPGQVLPENRNGRYHSLSRPERSRRRRGGVLTLRSGFNGLKRQEATKRAVSLAYVEQRLMRAKTKPAVSFGLRFVSSRLRLASPRFASARYARHGTTGLRVRRRLHNSLFRRVVSTPPRAACKLAPKPLKSPARVTDLSARRSSSKCVPPAQSPPKIIRRENGLTAAVAAAGESAVSTTAPVSSSSVQRP